MNSHGFCTNDCQAQNNIYRTKRTMCSGIAAQWPMERLGVGGLCAARLRSSPPFQHWFSQQLVAP